MRFPDFPNLSSPSIHFPTHLSPLSHTHSLLSHHLPCLPHVSLILFSQNSVLFAGNNVETTQLYICVRHRLVLPSLTNPMEGILGDLELLFSVSIKKKRRERLPQASLDNVPIQTTGYTLRC